MKFGLPSFVPDDTKRPHESASDSSMAANKLRYIGLHVHTFVKR